MKKFCTAIITLLMLFVIGGCNDENAPLTPSADNTMGVPVISLGPASSEYSIDDVIKGDVQFAVSVENKGSSGITFAHPTICFPADYHIGESLDFRERHGKSEILLRVKKPDGSIVLLRDGPHFFDPDGISYFVVAPGESDLFYIGWFFQNARGGWEDDLKAENIFTQRGEYKLKLFYRNFFPKALIPDAATSKSHFIAVWTGELQSNEVTVTVN